MTKAKLLLSTQLDGISKKSKEQNIWSLSVFIHLSIQVVYVVYFDQLRGARPPWGWSNCFFSAVFKRFI
jgi:hypothetical protein